MCYICDGLANGNATQPQSYLFGGAGSSYSYRSSELFGGPAITQRYEAINGGGSLSGTGNQAVDGILIGVRYGGGGGLGQSATVRYDFTHPIDGSVPFNSAAQQVTIGWMQKWSNIANLNFVNVTSGDFEISYGMKNLSTGGGVKGYAALSYAGSTLHSGPIVLDDDAPSLPNNHFQYSAIGHEIGHGLGLAHSFAGGNPSNSTVGPNKNNTDYSVMAYTGGPYSSSPNRVVETPMWGDVMAIRYLYGKNVNYHSGNDTFTPTQTLPMTVVDGAGVDTLLASSATGNSKIDLRFDWGSTSDDRVNLVPVSGGMAKFWFADQFENAIAGSGNDKVTGNDANNYLYGGAGNDEVNGLNGNDALFGGASAGDPNDGNDVMDGGAGNDIMFGNGGNDTLAGGEGNDTLFGGNGNDIMYGNTGVDQLYRGPGQDSMYGGLGNDAYYIGWNDGSASIVYQFEGIGINGGDRLIILDNANGSGVHNVADVIAKMITTPDGHHTWINGLNVLVANVLPNQFGADDISVVTSF